MTLNPVPTAAAANPCAAPALAPGLLPIHTAPNPPTLRAILRAIRGTATPAAARAVANRASHPARRAIAAAAEGHAARLRHPDPAALVSVLIGHAAGARRLPALKADAESPRPFAIVAGPANRTHAPGWYDAPRRFHTRAAAERAHAEGCHAPRRGFDYRAASVADLRDCLPALADA